MAYLFTYQSAWGISSELLLFWDLIAFLSIIKNMD